MQLTNVERDEDSAPFFDGTAEGRLIIRLCGNGHYSAPMQGIYATPTIRCHVCASPDLRWAEVSGDATLVSWTIPHDRSGAAVNIAGIVELAEGPWMQALIDAAVGSALKAGQALKVGFIETEGEGEKIPAFRPV